MRAAISADKQTSAFLVGDMVSFATECTGKSRGINAADTEGHVTCHLKEEEQAFKFKFTHNLFGGQ